MQFTFVFCIWSVFLSYATGEDYVVIMHSKSRKCLNPETTWQSNGVKMILYQCYFWGPTTPHAETFLVVEADNGTVLFLPFTFPGQGCIYTGMQDADPLYTKACDLNDETQQWIVKKVNGTYDDFQLVQKATGRCLEPFPDINGDFMRSSYCYPHEREQRWKICDTSGLCRTSF